MADQENDSYCIVYNNEDDYYPLLAFFQIKEPSVTMSVTELLSKGTEGIKEL